MRGIKFRAWDKTVNKMAKVTRMDYSDVQYTAVHYQYINYEGKKVDDLSLLDEKGHGTIVLLQYTGLKDRNGKEIYEGDIVLLPMVDGYKGDTAKFVFYPPNYYLEGFKGDYQISEGHCPDAYIVIGNIYENPELLEG